MKKYFSNIFALAALLIASATLAACSNDDGIVDNAQPAQQQAPQVYTLTLQAGKADNAQTRALALDGEKLVASWANGDQLTVTMADGTEVGTLTASTASGQTATFSGTLTVPSGKTIEANNKLTLTYHPVASLAGYDSQTGTLASASDYDVATTTVTVASVNETTKEITISESEISFATQTAVLKITMKDGSDNALNATSLKVSATVPEVGTQQFFTFTVPSETYTTNGDGVLYFALPSAATVAEAKSISTAALAALPVTFTATVGSDTYTATKTGYSFAAGKYYATTLKMSKAAAGVPAFCTMTEGERCAFFEAPAAWGGQIYVWAWMNGGDGEAYLGTSWPGVTATKLGTAGNGNSVWKWNVSGSVNPDNIIFNIGTKQTADLKFTNGGYYGKEGLKATVTP